MKKNRARSAQKKNDIQPTPQLVNEMRGLVEATRPWSGLRSLTPTQARARINVLESEVYRELSKSVKRRPSQGAVLRQAVPGRRPANKSALYGQRMPAPVRDLFQDARRALVCASRETRREIMFAMRRTGKAGARRNRKARWRADSYVSCKGR